MEVNRRRRREVNIHSNKTVSGAERKFILFSISNVQSVFWWKNKVFEVKLSRLFSLSSALSKSSFMKVV